MFISPIVCERTTNCLFNCFIALSSITSIAIISVDMHPSFATSDLGSSGDGDESESNDDNAISGNGPVTDPDAAPVTDPATTTLVL